MNYQRVKELSRRNREATARVYSAQTQAKRVQRVIDAMAVYILLLIALGGYLAVSTVEYRDKYQSIQNEQQKQAAEYADARNWYQTECTQSVYTGNMVCKPNSELSK